MGEPDSTGAEKSVEKSVEKIALKLPFFRRMRDRFKLLSRKKRYAAMLVAALFLLLLLLGIVVAILSIKSLMSDDLALYVSASPNALALNPGTEATVTISTNAKNLPFCTAQCTYTATDQMTGVRLTNGSLAIHAGVISTISVPYTAPATFERDGLLSISFVCANTPSTLCRSDGATRYATTVVHIASRYPPAQAAARDAVAAAIPAWHDALTQDASFLTAFTTDTTLPSDARAAPLVDDARTTLHSITTTIAAMHDALAHEEYTQAHQYIASFTPTTIASQYDTLRLSEADAITRFNAITLNLSTLERLTPLADTTDAALIARLAAAARTTGAQFTTQSLNASVASITSIEKNTTAIAPLITANANIMLADAEAAYDTDAAVLCALYADAAACTPANRSMILVDRYDAVCAATQTLSSQYATSRLAFARAALNDTNATLAQALMALNVTSVTSSANFSAWRASTLAAVRTTRAVGPLSAAHVLALDPQPLANATAFGCDRTFASIPPLTATLPLITPATVTVPTFTVPPQQCCDGGTCVACPGIQQTPVVFVHGFSFSQGTTPETNLNAFGPMAYWFDEHGVRYLGHVFPQQDAAANTTVNDLPGRFSMTTTYYYDSYSQNGKIALVSQKSENIETYAIRLREAITAARARTGSQKVIIVAHSMGGLVTRRYLQIFGENDVAAVILIGTPNAGITGSTAQFCGILGSSLECRDMTAGSVFMEKLNAGPQPTIPLYTIRGEGCDNRAYDGVVDGSSVTLPWATHNYVFNGTCSGVNALHSTLLDPTVHPEVAALVKTLVEKY